MPNKLAHFAIEAENVDRARVFYETVFGWTFEPWGPPGSYLIQNAGVHGALQSRREPMPAGRKGYECSFAVDDLDRSIQLIRNSGGWVDDHIHTIPTVGRLVSFRDTEQNQALIIQYEAARRRELEL